MAFHRNTYSALIVTTIVVSLIVFLGFTIHINKKRALIAETFYELTPEALDKQDAKKELKDIIKSLDKLLSSSTNKAYNTSKPSSAINSKKVNETFENLENSTQEQAKNTENNTISPSNQNSVSTQENSTFNAINNLISKKKRTTETNTNSNSSVSYSLTNRSKISISPPVYLCEKEGEIIVNIVVNNNGIVTDASYNTASTSTDGCMIDHALEYAKTATFSIDTSRKSQLGSITFYFKGK